MAEAVTVPDTQSPSWKRSSMPVCALLGLQSRAELVRMAVYASLSLAAALLGSLAALLLVPLIRPGRPLILGGGISIASGNVGWLAACFAVASAVFALLRWLSARLGARLVSDYAVNLRGRVHDSLIEAPLHVLADATSAEIANVLTYNIEIITQGFGAVLQLSVAGLTTAVSLGFAFWVSPALMLASPVLLGFGLMAARIYGREQSRISCRYVADMTRLFWSSEDFPHRLRHVRSFQREDAEKAGYGDISSRLGRGYRRQLELVASGRLMLELLAASGIAAVFVIAHRWQGADQAALIAVSLLLGRLLPYLVSTRQSFQQLRSAAPAFELWQRYARLGTAGGNRASTQMAVVPSAVHIERLGLTLPPGGLHARDVRLVRGELTLIRGDSGIGKSCLVDVLAGMIEPDVFVANTGAATIDFDGYRDLVRHGAYVGQSVRPWQRTVRECLEWAAPGVSDAELAGVLVDVGLEMRLAGSGGGLDTPLDSASSRFSGGELQRLLLAQVMLRRPVLGVLDETTNALDAASELAMLQMLRRRLPRTILVVVAHRAGVAAIADQVVTIDGDRIAKVARRDESMRITKPVRGSRAEIPSGSTQGSGQRGVRK